MKTLTELNAEWQRVFDKMKTTTPRGEINQAAHKKLERIEAQIVLLRKRARIS